MKTKTKKTLIIISIIASVLIAVGILLPFLLIKRAQKPDARALLAEAEGLSEQNLCLLAILREEPGDEQARRRLLTNYACLGADPLVIEASKGGLEITLPEAESQREEPGELLGCGGILQGKARITHYKDCGGVATDGETVYLAKSDGLYAGYHGLEIKLSPARAGRMIAAENGLYYLNTLVRRVQYIARDGHRTETLSPIEAADFAFSDGKLWIAGRDGTLYCEGVRQDAPKIQELLASEGAIYAVTDQGLWKAGEGILVPSSLHHLVSGGGMLYYLNETGFPCRYDPATKEAVILKETTALSLGYSEGSLYQFTPKRTIKELQS